MLRARSGIPPETLLSIGTSRRFVLLDPESSYTPSVLFAEGCVEGVQVLFIGPPVIWDIRGLAIGLPGTPDA